MFNINYEIEKSIEINKKLIDVMDAVKDFSKWSNWSPWFCLEPKSTMSFSGEKGTVGHSQHWEGKYVGAGKIIITKITDTQVDYDLIFEKPMKGICTVQFALSAQKENLTKVNWKMQGDLPFFLFFCKKMIVENVGRDFDRGLKMLKEYLEKGQVLSKIEHLDRENIESFDYLGISITGEISKIDEVMGKVIGQIIEETNKLNIPKDKEKFLFTLVKKWDYSTNTFECICAKGYEFSSAFIDGKSKLPADTQIKSGTIPTHKSISVKHTGSYNHLANGWTALMSRMKAEKIKGNSKIGCYEVYENSPHDTPEKDLVTKIYCAF